MQGHRDRILTTHVGSLPRTVGVLDGMKARRGGEDVDEASYRQKIRDGVYRIMWDCYGNTQPTLSRG